MRTEDSHVLRFQVIGVVFHEGGSSFQALPHHLHDTHQRRCLPVALGAEAVTVGHESLDSQSRQLDKPVQILEVGGEGFEASLLQEDPHAGLNTCRLPDSRRSQRFRRSIVFIPILPYQSTDLPVRHLADGICKVADTVSVNLIIKMHLC